MEPWGQQDKRQVFALIFDAIMKRLGETQHSLARAVGADQGTLSRWKNLRVRPRRLEFRELFHKTLGLDYDQLDVVLWLAGHRLLDQWEVQALFDQSVIHRRKNEEELQAEAARFVANLMEEADLQLPHSSLSVVQEALLKSGIEIPRTIQADATGRIETPTGPEFWSTGIHQFQTLIEDKTSGFVGREYVFEAINSFLAQQPNGYFVIEGDPGVGKSAILAEYVRSTDCVAHFNVQSQGINRADRFLESICGQLIHRYGLPYSSLPPEATRDGSFLASLLDQISRQLAPEEKLVIAVDALDEVDPAGQGSGANLLYLPPSLPEGVYIVATRRPVTLPLLTYSPYYVFDLMQHPEESRQDVRTYLRQAAERPALISWRDAQGLGTEDFVAVLAERSENNFMYLRYVLGDIQRGIYRDLSIESLPEGLEGYYQDHWRRMGMTARPLPRSRIKVVYIMAEAREPISRRLVARFASEDELTVQEVLDQWEQFLHRQLGEEEQTLYSVYHASFRDFLHRKDVVQAAGVSIGEINARIADNLWQELFPDE